MATYRLAYPKYRVFIYGTELTADVTSVAVDQHDGDAPNTCQISLLSEDDKYIINTQDIIMLRGLKLDKGLDIPALTHNKKQPGNDNETQAGPEADANQIFGTNKVTANFSSILSPIKRKILENKVKVTQHIDVGDRLKIASPTTKPLPESFRGIFGDGTIPTYPLADGASIFHPMDPVRVFMRDPYDPAKWYHHFTGYVSDIAETVSENGEKVLTLGCEDVTKLFRYTRVTINPGILDATIKVLPDDIVLRSFWSNFLVGYSLAEAAFTLMFGSDATGSINLISQNVGRAEPDKLRTRGIGHFSYAGSGIFVFGPEQYDGTGDSKEEQSTQTLLFSAKKTFDVKLNEWQALMHHEVSHVDLWSMLRDDKKNDSKIIDSISDTTLTDAESIISYIGEHIEDYPVDGGRLLVMLPKSLGIANRNIIDRGFIDSYPLNTEAVTVGEILHGVVERIDFCIYCTPKGDIIIEPPFYDFSPEDFGLEQVSGTQLVDLYNKVIEPATSFNKDEEKSLEAKIKQNKENEQNNLRFANTNGSNLSKAFNAVTSLNRAFEDNANLIEGIGNSISDVKNTFRKQQDALKVSNKLLSKLKSHVQAIGPFGPNFVIRRSDTVSIEHTFTDSKIHTLATVPWTLIQYWPSTGSSELIGKLEKTALEELIPLYGVRALNVTPKGYMASPEAAKLYGEIVLNRANADAHSAKILHMPNLKLWLNRPIYVEKRNYIVTTKRINHNLIWNSDMSTTCDVNSFRMWNGTMSKDNPNQPVFTHLGSGASRHLDYAKLFKTRSTSNTTTIQTTQLTKPGKDQI